MNFLLRLFPQYAALEMKCAAQTEHIVLLTKQAELSEARTADIRAVADAAWRNLYGRSIFGTGAEPLPTPAEYVAPQSQHGRKMARELVAEQEAAAVAQWAKQFQVET